ncbi:MAG: glucose 1-dehydrogenase [Myxococcales bacterium]|nr:glucose 1-dehydrogenase [Myxococcales bacterium]
MAILQGKTAVITGGSSGIGLAIATRFVAEGAYVFITGRDQGELDRASARIGRNVTAIRSDASDPADLERAFAAIRAERGTIDIVVANAGRSEQVSLADATPAHFDKLFGVNVRGVFFTVQKALPLLVDGASIVLVASAVHARGLAGLSVYSATKAAVRSLARSFAAELKDRRIRVNSLSPGAADTQLLTGEQATREQAEELRTLYGSWIPLGRIARTDEIAAAALFLASSESSFSTGTDLVADGGFTQL